MNTLRPQFGTDGTMNAVHGSDSVDSARRELSFHFPGLLLEPLPGTVKARSFVEAAPTITALVPNPTPHTRP